MGNCRTSSHRRLLRRRASATQTSRFDVTAKQRMTVARGRGELRVKLHTDEPRMIPQLDNLDQHVIDRCAGDDHSLLLQGIAILVIELVAMTMALHHRIT